MAKGSVNKVILIGNLGADPEVRYTQAGSAVATLRIATTEQWRDRSSGENQERTEWHRVVLFGKLGEIAKDYLHKGGKIYVEGRLQTRKWQGQDGQDRYTTEVVADQMQMLDSRGSGGSVPLDEPGGSPSERRGAGSVSDKPDFDDDIPF